MPLDLRMQQDPFLPGGPRPTNVGCGCILPGSGLVLLGLTVLLTVLIARNTTGYSPLWLALLPLIAGIVVLFVRIRVSRSKP